MLVTPLPNVILVRLAQPPKDASPMLVTLSGIVMLVRLVQPLKAPAPMLVTLSGIVMLHQMVRLPPLCRRGCSNYWTSTMCTECKKSCTQVLHPIAQLADFPPAPGEAAR